MCEKSILDPIPHTQHRPICVTVKPVIVPQPTPFRRRFNLRKTDWLGYSTQVDQNIDEIDATPECYEKFDGIIRITSRKHIPRGCRTNYIPGLTNESKTLYEAYQKQYRCNPLHSIAKSLSALDFNFERVVGGSILTAGKKLSETSECNNSGYKLTGLTWWP